MSMTQEEIDALISGGVDEEAGGETDAAQDGSRKRK